MAGGCPQKYVTGAMVEGEIAAKHIVATLKEEQRNDPCDQQKADCLFEEKIEQYNAYLARQNDLFDVESLEEAMQKVMDQYAGGISTHYQFNEKQLTLAKEKIDHLIELSQDIGAKDMHELMFVYELKERLTVCLSVIAHLKARKETRWHSFAENLDYPQKSDAWLKYVNSRMEDGKLKIIFRDLVGSTSPAVFRIFHISFAFCRFFDQTSRTDCHARFTAFTKICINCYAHILPPFLPDHGK